MTGPLGQGWPTRWVWPSRWLASRRNKPGFELFNFDVYALMGDGDMMEGISDEKASLAGHLGLSELCWIYDNDHATVEGNTALAFSEDVGTIFSGYDWNLARVSDANDLGSLSKRSRCASRGESHPFFGPKVAVVTRCRVSWLAGRRTSAFSEGWRFMCSPGHTRPSHHPRGK